MVVDIDDFTVAVKAARKYNRDLYDKGDHMSHMLSRQFSNF